MKPLKIGTVPYLNIDPFMRALSAITPVEVVYRHPSGLPELLNQGMLDVCLLSAPEIFERGLEPLDGASISADGPVLSVVIQSRVAAKHWRRIALDGHSISSNRLAGVVLRDLLGMQPDFQLARDPEGALHAGSCDAAVLIGDRALRAHGRAPAHDLAALWRAYTGLPFVFAAWVRGPRGRCSRVDLEALLAGAAARSLEFVEESVDSHHVRLGVERNLLERYLTEHISYRFGAAERLGMEWFRRRLGLHREPAIREATPLLRVGGVS